MGESAIWVVNSSPIIALSKVGRLDLLRDENRRVRVPEAVVGEIRMGPPDDPARKSLEAGWELTTVPDEMAPEVMEWGLGLGETAVLSEAKREGATAIVDDRAARTAANIMGVRVMGTLGVVIRARMAGRIPSSVEILQELKRNGLRLRDAVIREALSRTTGEEWLE